MTASPSLVGRYEVKDMLAQGGMAIVYRARDKVTDQVVALKRVLVTSDDPHRADKISLFEREFHTLTHFAHPRVVRVFDYGTEQGVPYYAMELLDGGDLAELIPMAWQEVCRVAYDVCSALSLLHSRRLLHLDVSPRNIRRTADGTAKIIDFGLLSPMGPRSMLGGTPSYVAPEAFENLALDARADLYSLGAVLYLALTGINAYPAKALRQLPELWQHNPPPPSQLVEVPPALERLVLSLIRLDREARPKSAAEVMACLLPLLSEAPTDLHSVTCAYLSTPLMVGRERALARLRAQMKRALTEGGRGLIFTGPAGIGRSRMLDAFALEAKLLGAVTLRTGASAANVPLGAAAEIVRQFHEAFPDESIAAAHAVGVRWPLLSEGPDPQPQGALGLGEIAREGLNPAALQESLRGWLLAIAAHRPLAIAVDDLHLVDEPSAVLLATLAAEAEHHRIAYAITLDEDAPPKAVEAIDVLLSRAERVALEPLSEDEVKQLLGSIFGGVPHLHLLSRRLHALCAGRPRECMLLAHALVDDGSITYSDGAWVLPLTLDAGQLPPDMDAMLARKVKGLSPLSRHIAALLGLGLLRTLRRADLLQLERVAAADIDAALDALISTGLATQNATSYSLCHDGFNRHVLSDFSEAERKALHRQLAHLYVRAEADPLIIIHHLLLGDEAERALSCLFKVAPDPETWERLLDRTLLQLRVDKIAQTLRLALAAAERSGLRAPQLFTLRERVAHMSTLGDGPDHYYHVAEACVRQLKQDSGLNDFHALDASSPAPERIQQALGMALGRYQETPEPERGLSPIEAIAGIARWLLISIPVAGRAMDLALVASLPPLIEPFAPIDLRVSMVARNARASWLYRCTGRWQEARELWLQVLDDVDAQATTGAEMTYTAKVRTAICSILGGLDASLGLESSWEQRLQRGESDPQQLPQVYNVKRLEALCAGDWSMAERYRERAELSQLHVGPTQPLSILVHEIDAQAAARNLTGLGVSRVEAQRMVAQYPGWGAVATLTDAYYHRLCGDLEVALQAVDRALQAAAQQAPWYVAPSAVVLKTEILVDLNRLEEALIYGEAALRDYSAAGIAHVARELARALSLAQARLGHVQQAVARIDDVIAQQEVLGVTGLQLGLSYEIRARVALIARDAEGFARCLALLQSRHSMNQMPALGALCERLREEARKLGLELGSLPGAASGAFSLQTASQLRWRIDAAMANCKDEREYAMAALQLLCEGDDSRCGYLFMCTGHGLQLAASNATEEDLPEVAAFAQHALEYEVMDLEGGQTTMLDAEAEMAAGTASCNVWQAPDGTPFAAMLLRATDEPDASVIGVAVLKLGDLSSPQVDLYQLVPLLAQRLLVAKAS